MMNSVLRYLENTAAKLPDKEAIVEKENSVSFKELLSGSRKIGGAICNKIGRYQRKPVFVYLPKSAKMIEAFFGILYSGCYYTPTDVRFPFEKINGILQVLDPRLILTDSDHIGFLEDNGIDKEKILNIDEIDDADVSDVNADRTIDTDIAYILFTSGSTGVPKGVMISHRSIADYIDWAKECYGICEENRIASQAPFYFDNSTLDIYLMASSGATLFIVPESYYSFPAKLMGYVAEKSINTVFWVPSVFINVANADILSKIDCNCLSTILFAGEVMPNKHLNYWRRYIPNALYSNLYGPTEITVDCTYYIVDREFDDDESLPIGRPCPNTEIIVLDNDDKAITEKDVIGELCVRGTSLALGYWRNPEKTKEVFVQNPLNPLFEEKIYRTGDLVHYNERGEIMYDGRKDFQIKHLGYRIELGEIEVAAIGIPGIEEDCVLYNDKAKEIVLFYVGEGINDAEIRKAMLKRVPKYMVPTVYHKLDRFPYNDNGKIDRKKIAKEYIK